MNQEYQNVNNQQKQKINLNIQQEFQKFLESYKVEN